MRFLVDKCTGPAVARWLRDPHHDVFSVYEEARGQDDDSVLHQALAEDRIVITNDKDFGDIIFREKRPHKGIILLRLSNERAARKIAAIERLLQNYSDQLPNRFVVVTESTVRIVGT